MLAERIRSWQLSVSTGFPPTPFMLFVLVSFISFLPSLSHYGRVEPLSASWLQTNK